MQFIAFIIIFGVIVLVHEFGHFYFAKKSGILVREFAIGMGPKIFAHVGKDGTAYTIRILPLGGYVRMAGWGEDTTEIKTGTPVSLTLNPEGTVVRINLSGKNIDQTALPMNVTDFDFEDKLEITGIVIEETKTYPVHHDATIVEEDGTEVRIAPLDVQYQNASIWGRLITNFAGPMNNFILSIVVYSLLAFMRGGAVDYYSNHVQVVPQGVVAKAGLKDNDQIVQINEYKVSNWDELTDSVQKATRNQGKNLEITITYERDGKTQKVTVQPEEDGGRYYIGVTNAVKTGFLDKLLSGVTDTWYTATRILTALKDIFFHSMCEHHFLPFYGKVHIAYIPNGRVAGLSKLARTVEVYAKKPQIQERLTVEIADALMEYLGAQGALVWVEAEHMCMNMRGVRKPGTATVTTAARGLFETDKDLKNEAYKLMGH